MIRFVSISAGLDHLLALTSTGRAFAYPVTKNANAYGQLGLRRITLPSPSLTVPAAITRLEAELIPKFSADPFAQSTPYTRPKPSQSSDDSPKEEGDLSKFDDADIKFCDRLFEVPSLKGIKIAQVAAGGRSSFALTENGRVLGWGANEYGYGCHF
jgi:alpha-tubulin suppressor-like RCC1 family protein